jgi:hypothetical protein
LGLSDLRSGHLSTRAFAVPVRPQRFRRPTDGVLLGFSLVLVAITAVAAADAPGDLENSFANWLSNLPGVFDFVWKVSYDLAQILVLIVGLAAIIRRRWGLLRDWALGIGLAFAGALFIGWLVDGSIPSLSDSLGPTDGTPVFPSLVLSLTAAAVTIVTPYLVSPMRKFARSVLVMAWLSAIVLGVTAPGESACAVAIGWAAASLVHLVFDLVAAVDQHVASTGAIEHLAPHLHEESGVPRVPTVYVDDELAVIRRDCGGDHHAVAHVDAGRGGVDADRPQ